MQAMRKNTSVTLHAKKWGDCWFALALNDEGELVCSTFSRKGENDAKASLSLNPQYYPQLKRTPSLCADRLFKALYEIYRGESTSIDIGLDMRFIAPFHRTVYVKTRQIPQGKVTTYGRIARSLGSVSLSRAVGHANAANPFVLAIPCHRVVPWTREVGNYGRGPQIKREILIREGVLFEGKRISESSVWVPMSE
jgi:methylated-DNA-[protein]-cysteine S-methyltransferase